MIKDGLILVFTGMGTVFTFLTILWFSVFCMGKIVMKLNAIFPEQTAKIINNVKKISDTSAEIALAIASALRR